METSQAFKNTIASYLNDRANTDSLFAVAYAKEGKNIDDCITYILNTVQKSGCNGFTDDEIFSMAVHYYDEDQIEVGKPVAGRVVVNHTIEITDEEKAEAKKAAIRQIQDEAISTMKRKPETKKATKAPELQTSLFD
jgi:hypothetical protein